MVLPLLRPNLDHTQGREHLWLVTDVTAQQPEIVGRYQLGRLLGVGAFGSVRLAKLLSTGARLSFCRARLELADLVRSVSSHKRHTNAAVGYQRR